MDARASIFALCYMLAIHKEWLELFRLVVFFLALIQLLPSETDQNMACMNVIWQHVYS